MSVPWRCNGVGIHPGVKARLVPKGKKGACLLALQSQYCI